MATLNDDMQAWYKLQNARFGLSADPFIIGYTTSLSKEGAPDTDPDYTNAVGDYSLAPQSFTLDALPAGVGDVTITRLVINIQDADIDSAGYGGLAALTNGISVQLMQFGKIINFPFTIKQNSDYLSEFTGNQQLLAFGGGNPEQVYRVSLDFDASAYINLRSGTTDQVMLTLNDDFTGLTRHNFTATGFISTPG